MTEEELSILCDELLAWEAALKPKRDEWDLLWKAWTITPEQPDPGNPFISKVRVPYGFHAVETILPRILGQDARVSYRALDDKDDQPVAAIMGGLASWQMELMGFDNEARTFGRQGLVCGYSVAKVGWTQRWQRRTHRRVLTEYDQLLRTTFETEHEHEEDVLVRNQPFFETVNIYDFVYPLAARSIRDASAVWQRRWVTLGYLRGRRDVYANVDDVQGDDYGQWQTSRQGQFEPQGLTSMSRPTAAQDPDSDDALVELWERWTDERLVAIASPHGQRVALRDEANPFWHRMKPFVDWAPIPHPFQLHGVGVIAPIYDLNEDLNTMRRQRRDAVTYTLNPMWKAVGGFNTDRVILRPGGIVDVNDQEDLQPLITPPSSFGEAMQEEERLIQDMQNLSGAFNYLSGDSSMSAAGAQTATGVATITQEGNKRIQEMVKTLDDRAMKPFGRMLASLNSQYVEEDFAVDFSKSPEARQAWHELSGVEEPPSALHQVEADWLQARGRLEPVPEIGADKQVNDVQKRSDAVQVVQAIAPFVGAPGLLNLQALLSYVLEQFGVSKADRDAILAAPQPQAVMPMPTGAPTPTTNGAPPNGTPADNVAASGRAYPSDLPPRPSSSGPSGENLPTGAVVGAPGVAGA